MANIRPLPLDISPQLRLAGADLKENKWCALGKSLQLIIFMRGFG